MTGDRAAQQEVTWRRVLVSEFGKAARTRSVQVLIALELCLVVFFSAVVGVPGVQAASLPAGLAGAVTAGAEYSSGAIMSTVVAVGRRSRLFWAQLVSAAVVTALPALALMLGLVLTTRPYVDYRGVPFDLAACLETVVRAALVLALVAAAGALVAMGTRSVATAVMTLALGVGAAQILAMLVPALLTLGSWTVRLPDWVHVVMPNAVIARLQGVAALPASSWLEQPVATMLLAVAWCLPLFLWGHRRLTRGDF
ncbi:hypothetical protein [Actinomyces succiniciruminis]|uniref:ABC-2 family transporter protein n=1 Tax=Actinomyces succiniciruminis TaxID=1522002 RepID=A0A1L7RBD8_9ACTO|nr:hypothetical protein [Actinomyces succiniciruminis]CED91197.1 ABC-2 family transporter protein [Actinomyces succiniciruminis]